MKPPANGVEAFQHNDPAEAETDNDPSPYCVSDASADTAGGSSAGAGSAQSKSNYSGGMAIFTHATGGLMHEASLGGQKFSFNGL